MKNSFIILFFLLFVGIGKADNLKCLDNSSIKIPTDEKKFRIEKSSYCFSMSPWILKSKNCYQSKCEAMKYYNLKKPEVSAFGVPGSHLCTQAGGIAQTILFEVKSEYHKFNRCYFIQDKSFIDLGSFWSDQTKINF